METADDTLWFFSTLHRCRRVNVRTTTLRSGMLAAQKVRNVLWVTRWVEDLAPTDRQQWYQRRKLDAQCYVGHKFEDPVGHEESCPCTDADYEW